LNDGRGISRKPPCCERVEVEFVYAVVDVRPVQPSQIGHVRAGTDQHLVDGSHSGVLDLRGNDRLDRFDDGREHERDSHPRDQQPQTGACRVTDDAVDDLLRQQRLQGGKCAARHGEYEAEDERCPYRVEQFVDAPDQCGSA